MRLVIIDPVVCRTFAGDATNTSIEALMETVEDFAKQGHALAETPLDDHNIIIWDPKKLADAEARPDDPTAPARFAWFNRDLTPSEREHILSGGRDPRSGDTIQFAGAAVIAGKRDKDGKLTASTVTDEMLETRVGWDARRVGVAVMIDMMLRDRAWGMTGGLASILNAGGDDDDDADGENCECEACQMEKKASTAQRSKMVN